MHFNTFKLPDFKSLRAGKTLWRNATTILSVFCEGTKRSQWVRKRHGNGIERLHRTSLWRLWNTELVSTCYWTICWQGPLLRYSSHPIICLTHQRATTYVLSLMSCFQLSETLDSNCCISMLCNTTMQTKWWLFSFNVWGVGPVLASTFPYFPWRRQPYNILRVCIFHLARLLKGGDILIWLLQCLFKSHNQKIKFDYYNVEP